MLRRGFTIISSLVYVITSFALSPNLYAATNSELVPGSRIVFPYYDLRPGFSTFLFLTNVSTTPVSVNLEFYDASCDRLDTRIELSGRDVDALDLADMISADPSGNFRQGFVDVTTGADVLIGTAVVANTTDDWAIAYNGASARRQEGGATPFEPYPTDLVLPAFLTPGHIGGGVLADGLLIVAAPHPTRPGGKLSDTPIRTSAEILLRDEPTPSNRDRHRPHEMIRLSAGFNGHYLMLPMGTITGTPASPMLGWLSLTNHATDKKGVPFGLVGLYIQTLVGPGSASVMAVRLSGDPSAASSP